MAGSLNLGGMADGLLIGQVTIGPSTVSGKEAISEVISITLEANVDFVVKVPTNAVQFACIFTFEPTNPGEVKIGSNLSATTTGFPVLAQGFLSLPLTSGTTELKFKSATPPPVFSLVFI
jgi:hypothetical protein